MLISNLVHKEYETLFSFNIKHLVDFIALSVLYFFVFLPKWKQKEKSLLFIKTVMYVYLSFESSPNLCVNCFRYNMQEAA